MNLVNRRRYLGAGIYSMDMHPTQAKFATAGQSSENKAGLIVIWNLDPVVRECLQSDENTAKMLCRIEQFGRLCKRRRAATSAVGFACRLRQLRPLVARRPSVGFWRRRTDGQCLAVRVQTVERWHVRQREAG